MTRPSKRGLRTLATSIFVATAAAATLWSSPARACPPPAVEDCEDPEYFSTPCGADEWENNRHDPSWVCKPTFDNLTAGMPAPQPVVEPRETVDSDGNEIPRSNLTNTVPTIPADHSSFSDRPTFAISNVGTPQLYFDPRSLYRANGQHFDSCDEMVFESYRSYEEWYRDTRFDTPREAFDLAYSGPNPLYDVSSGQSLLVDAVNSPLATLRIPMRPANALAYWDRNKSRPDPHAIMSRPTLASHYALSQGLAQHPDDLLEYLQVRQVALTQALGAWGRLERQILEIIARSFDQPGTATPMEAREAQWDPMHAHAGVNRLDRLVTFTEALATRFETRSRQQLRTNDWLGSGQVPGAPGSGRPYPPGGPEGSYPGPAPDEVVHPGREDGMTMPVDVVDPDGEIFGDPLNPDDLFNSLYDDLVGDQFVHDQIMQVRGAQTMIADEIDALYDELAPLCTGNPSPCDWAPSVFRRDLERFYRPRVNYELNQCMQATGNDVDNLYRLMSDYVLPNPPGHWDVPYNETLANWSRFYINLDEYREAVRQHLAQGQEKIRQQMHDLLTANAGGDGYTFEGAASFEKTIGFAMAGIAIRQETTNDIGFDRRAMTLNPPPSTPRPAQCDPNTFVRLQAAADLKLLNATFSDAFRSEATHEPQPPAVDPLNGDPRYGTETNTGMFSFGLQVGSGTSFLPRLAIGYTHRQELLSLFEDILNIKPEVLVCTGVCLIIDGDVVSFLQGSVSFAIDMVETVDVCRPNGRRQLDTSAGVAAGFEAFARAAVGIPGIRAGIKGSIELITIGLTGQYSTELHSASPLQHVPAYIETYCNNDPNRQIDDDGDGIYDRCEFDTVPSGVGSPSAELVKLRQEYGVRGELSTLSGRVALFAEVGWSPLAIGFEFELFRWKGPFANFNLGKDGFETDSSFGFQAFCNPLLYRDFARWSGIANPNGGLQVDCKLIEDTNGGNP